MNRNAEAVTGLSGKLDLHKLDELGFIRGDGCGDTSQSHDGASSQIDEDVASCAMLVFLSGAEIA
ncbi:hypothetical protein ATO10_05846 [Actibacterium atlanticum]|uniref:Uncharacterized protein n=1 Tax=Actibacterium atlanticum TaxID=1461693 RepID=A0A058ZMH5_9RHOB|nr:hypothetical protein ATO10_05846 [Actibacterium atlanticum]